jgi:hypothetical protein
MTIRRKEMPEKINYYAIVDEFTSPEHPAGVLRRVKNDEGSIDEVFSGELKWTFSPLMYEAEQGDLENEFVPISEAEAERIVARIREAGNAGE